MLLVRLQTNDLWNVADEEILDRWEQSPHFHTGRTPEMSLGSFIGAEDGLASNWEVVTPFGCSQYRLLMRMANTFGYIERWRESASTRPSLRPRASRPERSLVDRVLAARIGA